MPATRKSFRHAENPFYGTLQSTLVEYEDDLARVRPDRTEALNAADAATAEEPVVYGPRSVGTRRCAPSY